MKTVLVPIKGSTKADILFTGFFKGEKNLNPIKKIEPLFAKVFEAAIKKERFTGKAQDSFTLFHPSNRLASEVIVLGLGEKKDLKPAVLRKIAGRIVEIASVKKANKVRVVLDTFLSDSLEAKEATPIFVETMNLAAYRFLRYKTTGKAELPKFPDVIELAFVDKKDAAELKPVVSRAEKIARAVIKARDLNNEPANVINPPRLAEESRMLAKEKGLRCKVLGLAELKKLGMNGILAVNRGSITPPALIILEHGEQYKENGTVCVVGKGVTFDTGGISIKPPKGMEEMKFDKSGAIAVIVTMGLVADLKLPLHVVGLAPCVENNVANDPQRPGDIIKMYNGKTVEVINTDAEGRLILADALSYCKEYKPDAIIDLATLTGLCHLTFGDKTSAILGNDQKLIDAVREAGEKTGERCWQLPLWDDYADAIKGNHSDINNTGDGYAGTITATMFLKEFVPVKTPWVHLDIAGTAYLGKNRYDCPKGATGFGVRLLAEVLSSWSSESFSK
ncbi:MAG: Cytosol aminopeptidase [Candidatus Omnitrophica bacterium ADurb.Bin277]|nr:MAG: Cytosol aminopeptidase [Candidatus Omnitrophica bacterium ADurb.Bin277]